MVFVCLNTVIQVRDMLLDFQIESNRNTLIFSSLSPRWSGFALLTKVRSS